MDLTSIALNIGHCFTGVNLSRGLYVGLFGMGIVGSFTHCAAMCGPFVIARNGQLHSPHHTSNIVYHCGRLTTYVILAALFSSALNLAYLFLPVRGFIIAPLLALAGTIFAVMAFPQLSAIFPWAVRLRVSLPYRMIAKPLAKLTHKTGPLKQYALGMLLGLMPCGLVISALMVATSAPTILESAFAMSFFALGTMPTLLAIQYGAKGIQLRFPKAVKAFTQIMLVWSSLWLFTLAGYLLI